MLSRASDRLTYRPTAARRAQGAALALLVQGGFLLMILFTPPHPGAPQRDLAREMILLLQPPPKTAPGRIDARGVSQPRAMPVPVLPTITPAPDIAPPSGLAGFGRSLFGCAPEHYADLPPDERAHCPKPGEGMAVNQPPDLLNPPKSHSKDEATWLEEQAEAHWMPNCTGAASVIDCQIEQSRAEHGRMRAAWQKIADDKAARLSEPKRPLPNVGVRRN